MDTTQETLKKDLRLLTTQLQTLRDEVRIQIHLASLDAKDVWRKLEPDVEQAAALAQQASKSSVATVEAALGRLQKFVRTLRDEAQNRQGPKPTPKS